MSIEPIKARIRTGYRMRPLLLAVLLIGYGLWAVNDYYFAYPEDNRQHARLVEFKNEVGEATAHFDQWKAYANEHNLPSDPNDIESHGASDMWFNFALVYGCLPVGLLALGSFIHCGFRYVQADEQGLRTHRAGPAPWSSLSSVDKSRWDAKGIAVVHYTHNGGAGRVTLDDWKYETEPTRKILDMVEQRLGVESSDEASVSQVSASDEAANQPADSEKAM